MEIVAADDKSLEPPRGESSTVTMPALLSKKELRKCMNKYVAACRSLIDETYQKDPATTHQEIEEMFARGLEYGELVEKRLTAEKDATYMQKIIKSLSMLSAVKGIDLEQSLPFRCPPSPDATNVESTDGSSQIEADNSLRQTDDCGASPGTEVVYTIEDFIEQVKLSPYLYDKYHVLHKDIAEKERRWAQIGARYGMDGGTITKKWTHIRDRYKRILNEVILHQERNESFKPSWKFYDVLHAMLKSNYNPPPKTKCKTLCQSSDAQLGVSPNTTISFSDVHELLHSKLQSLGTPPAAEQTPTTDRDIIASDYLVAETRIDEDDRSISEMSIREERLSDGVTPKRLREAEAPVRRSSKRESSSFDSDSSAGTRSKLKKRRKSALVGPESEPTRDYIDHFVQYIAGRIRNADDRGRRELMFLIHQTLDSFESEKDNCEMVVPH